MHRLGCHARCRRGNSCPTLYCVRAISSFIRITNCVKTKYGLENSCSRCVLLRLDSLLVFDVSITPYSFRHNWAVVIAPRFLSMSWGRSHFRGLKQLMIKFPANYWLGMTRTYVAGAWSDVHNRLFRKQSKKIWSIHFKGVTRSVYWSNRKCVYQPIDGVVRLFRQTTLMYCSRDKMCSHSTMSRRMTNWTHCELGRCMTHRYIV